MHQMFVYGMDDHLHSCQIDMSDLLQDRMVGSFDALNPTTSECIMNVLSD